MTRSVTLRSILGFALAAAAMAPVPDALASPDMLQKYRTLCAENAQCTAEMTSKGLLFRVNGLPGRTEKVLCQVDGACEALLPRGGRYVIKDVSGHLSSK